MLLLFISSILLFCSFKEKAASPQLSLFYKGQKMENASIVSFNQLKNGDLTLAFDFDKADDNNYFISAIQIYILKKDKTWELVGGAPCLEKDMTSPLTIPIEHLVSKSKGIAIEVRSIYEQAKGTEKTPIENSGKRFEIFAKE